MYGFKNPDKVIVDQQSLIWTVKKIQELKYRLVSFCGEQVRAKQIGTESLYFKYEIRVHYIAWRDT